jgi:hypothetical protein
MNKLKDDQVLWIDCIGGLVVGVLILCLCRLISEWDSLPLWIVLAVGFANLGYGGYSLWVTTRNPRPMALVKILAIANMAWLGVCVAIVVSHWSEISAFGIFHKLAEGIYVSSLRFMECNGESCSLGKHSPTETKSPTAIAEPESNIHTYWPPSVSWTDELRKICKVVRVSFRNTLRIMNHDARLL